MEEITITLFDSCELREYHVMLRFDGPAGTNMQQKTRKDYVTNMNLCSLRQIHSGSLEKTLKDPNVKMMLLYLDPVPGKESLLPEKLRGLFSRAKKNSLNPGVAVGMYVFDINHPCVLQYICLAEEAQGLRLGALMFRHYEEYVRSNHPQCRNIYLAAVDTINERGEQAVIAFYRGLGFEVCSKQPTEEEVAIIDKKEYYEVEKDLLVQWYVRTVLMKKKLPPTKIGPASLLPQQMNDSDTTFVITKDE